jgi:hypothetical protein
MYISLVKIKHALKLSEIEVSGGKSIELTGKSQIGKTSFLDAVKVAFTNKKPREVIVTQGADEASILIETDTGLSLERKFKADRDDSALSLKDNGMKVQQPQAFLKSLYTELQFDPVEFIHKSIDEQNRVILGLIVYSWDMSTIENWFGEIPKGVDYKQHILSVLDQIQADNGVYYQTRQSINSDILHEKKSIQDIGLTIPAGYNVAAWEAYSTEEKYAELSKIQQENSKIERAKAFKASYDNSLRGIQADRDIAISNAKDLIKGEREGLLKTIERLKAEIKAAEDKIDGLDSKLSDKERISHADFETAKAKLDADIGVADKYAGQQPTPTDALRAEISNAEAMKKFINEYRRMERMQKSLEDKQAQSTELTRKIELARKLPGQVLAEAKLPVDVLTVVNGKPLVNGLPLSNLSDGQRLGLCVDIAASSLGELKLILLNGMESLDDKSREALYDKCREKGVQFIATRVTNDDELMVVEL